MEPPSPAPVPHAIEEASPAASLPALLGVFFKLGLTSFGGGLSGWIHQEVVGKRAWMDEDQFMAGVALTQVLSPRGEPFTLDR